MGLLEEILASKEELIIKLLSVLEGKETKAKINLDGIKFKLKDATVAVDGEIELTFIPPKKE